MTPLADGVTQTLQPDAGPPPGENRDNQSGHAGPPKSRGPGTLFGQTESGSDKKPED